MGLFALQRGVGDHADQRALERSDAAVDPLRDLGQDVGGDLDAVDAGALGEDRPAQLGRRRLELDDEAGAEALGQPASRSGSSSGLRSEEITSWRPESSSALKVWKNSSRVLVRPARNCTSSISTTSALRKSSLKSPVRRRARRRRSRW